MQELISYNYDGLFLREMYEDRMVSCWWREESRLVHLELRGGAYFPSCFLRFEYLLRIEGKKISLNLQNAKSFSNNSEDQPQVFAENGNILISPDSIEAMFISEKFEMCGKFVPINNIDLPIRTKIILKTLFYKQSEISFDEISSELENILATVKNQVESAGLYLIENQEGYTFDSKAINTNKVLRAHFDTFVKSYDSNTHLLIQMRMVQIYKKINDMLEKCRKEMERFTR